MNQRFFAFSAAAAACLAVSSSAAHAGDYIALGDSYAYGFTTTQALVSAISGYETSVLTHTPDPADEASLQGLQGYVAPFAASQNISLSDVLNLAAPGETLGSFFSGGNSASAVNLNYLASPSSSQSALFASDLGTLKAGGGSVQDITVQLGGNDLLGLASQLSLTPPPVGQSPQLTPTQQFAVNTTLATFNASYVPLLSSLKSDAQNVYVVGYFDPFTPLGDSNMPPATNDPFFGYGSILLPDLNAALASDAAQAGVNFVNIDTLSTFEGHEIALSEDTQPLDASLLKTVDPSYTPSLPDQFPDYHPNPTGYAVIAGALQSSATAIPEPASWTLLLLGLPLTAMAALRRRA